MKLNHTLLATLAAASLLFAGSVLAQDATPPPASNGAMSAPAGGASGSSAQMQTPQGEVVINSQPAPAKAFGPAPSFEQLSGGGKSITPEQAEAYPPLANDFQHADSNRNGHISKAEYARWSKQD